MTAQKTTRDAVFNTSLPNDNWGNHVVFDICVRHLTKPFLASQLDVATVRSLKFATHNIRF